MAAVKAKKRNQIIGSLAATMGGFSLGTVIGWSAPANAILEKENMTNSQITHISSIMCLGAACAQLYLALTLDRIGRKWTMIIIAIPFLAAWVILGMLSNFYLYLVGRFFTGFCGGSFCVAAPTYIGEIAEKSIRGTLGILFQLLLVIGILFVFIFGLLHNRFMLCFPMIAPPLISLTMMIFLPESPVFLVSQKKDENARKALTFYRGKDYNIDTEIKEIEDYTKGGEGTFTENMKKTATIKGFAMLLVMHIIQQLSGINAVMFYATNIFQMASSNLSGDICTCILGVTQVLTCAVAAYLVERLGRKMLWLISLSVMAICLIILGIYFFIKNSNEKLATKIAFIPLIVVCLYIVGFCFAAGPLPWAMIGELLPSGVKGVCGSIITFVNWMLAYTITMSYPFLVEILGAGPVFIAYGIVCVLGFVYILFFVIETKNKTLDEIQTQLSGG